MKTVIFRRGIIFIVVVFAMFIGGLATGTSEDDSLFGDNVYATDVSDKVDFTVNVDPQGPFDANQYVKINVDFTANPQGGNPDGYVNGGDTFTISWESEDDKVRFDAFTATELELKDASGKTLAYATITKDGATVTFHENVNTMHDIAGSLEINGYVRNNNEKDTENKTVKIRITGQADTNLEIRPGGAEEGTPRIFRKTGHTEVLEDDTVVFEWNLKINGEFKEDFTGTLSITDSLAGKGHIFVSDDDKKGSYYIRVTDKNDPVVTQDIVINGKNVRNYRKTTGYYYNHKQDVSWANHTNKFVVIQSPTTTMEEYLEDISFSSDSKTMTINIPAEKVNGKSIEIIYYTVPIENHDSDNGKFENFAELEYSDSTGTGLYDDWSDDIYYEDSSGKITGVPNETFKIVKYEKGTTTPIKGVTFNIKRDDGARFRDGDLEKEVTTDEKGEVLVTNLAPGKYLVTELSAPNIYIVSDEQYEFEMVHEGIEQTIYNEKTAPGTTRISVRKEWERYRPAEAPAVVAVLSGSDNWDGKDVDGTDVTTEITLDADNGWKHTWMNLPEKDSSDNAITYSVEEQTVPTGFDSTVSDDGDGNFKITNTNTEKVNIAVIKRWMDGGESHTPTEVKLTLMRESEEEVAAPVSGVRPTYTDADEGETFTFSDLPKYDESGYEYTYWVTEEQVDGYVEPRYSNTGDNSSITDKAYNGATITNTAKTSISGSKTWNDDGNKAGKRPDSITINLMNGDKQVGSKVVTEDDEWTWTFSDLPKYDDEGVEIEYTISEDPVELYDTEIDGYDVTNIYAAEEKPLLSIKKTSNIRSAKPGDVIPYIITITNKGNGDAEGVDVLDTMDDNLTYVSDDHGGTVDGQTVTWTVDIPAGETEEITISCRIKASATGKVVNNVEITNVESEFVEPEEGDDEFSVVLGEYEDQATDDDEPEDEPKDEPKDKEKPDKSSRTGDERNMLLGILALIASTGGLTLYGYRRRRA